MTEACPLTHVKRMRAPEPAIFKVTKVPKLQPLGIFYPETLNESSDSNSVSSDDEVNEPMTDTAICCG